MQQIYAKIKKSSKYYGQGDGTAFEVQIATYDWEYKVVGGPGGQYRLTDVNLFVMSDDGDKMVRIS